MQFNIYINIYIEEALVKLQAQLNKDLIVKNIGIVYKKMGYKFNQQERGKQVT